MSEVECVPRARLHSEIWAEPATTVAARYGVTSTGLAKICSRLRIPAPPRGYWQKKEAGQVVAMSPLPEPAPVMRSSGPETAGVGREHTPSRRPRHPDQ